MNANIMIRDAGANPAITNQKTLQVFLVEDANLLRPFFVTKWQLLDLFSLYDAIAIKVSNIEKQDKVGFELLPYDDILKRQILMDSTNNYYFILFKNDIKPDSDIPLFRFNVILQNGIYSIYISYMVEPSEDEGGGGEQPPTNGVLIPNPPRT